MRSLDSTMASRNNLTRAFLLLLAACVAAAHEKAKPSAAADAPAPSEASSAGGPIDITKLGASGDGKTDSTKAIMEAWTTACAATGAQTIVIPKGDYAVGPLPLSGPCKGQVTLQVDGNLLATTDLSQYKKGWIDICYVDNLVIAGTGTLDGQGAKVWDKNACSKAANCKTLPNSLVLNFCKNATIGGITLLNSKFFHMTIFQCKDVRIECITITAPEDSPNTDGIHVGDSTGVKIKGTTIGTGDDCISIGPGSQNVDINGVHCGPGHGISIGSLGRYSGEKDVTGITVANCTLTGTTNGLRIKSYESSPTPLSASKISYQDITMKDVQNPIIIDQKYCPNKICPPSSPSKVKISDVTFRNIKGTSASAAAVSLLCADNLPCQGVQLVNVDVKYSGTDNTTRAVCNNVKGSCSGTIEELSCL